MTAIALYKKYFVDNNFERTDLFARLRDRYQIESALYPGSFVHVTPSFYFPKVVYVDTDGQAKKFFADKIAVKKIIDHRKAYYQDPNFDFIGMNYTQPLDLKVKSFDFLISQYAGIISQPCKKYLKTGGLLLANNSHGDAGVAYLDQDYELVGVIKTNKGKQNISETGLDKYFIPKSKTNLTIDYLIGLGKGIGYTKTASAYLFRRLK